jgi:flagellar protein FlgJ
MMIKSMRQASQSEDGSQGHDAQIYTSMLDQQLSQTMAKRGVGLADYLLRQMSPTQATATASTAAVTVTPNQSIPAPVATSVHQSANKTVLDFQTKMALPAQEASQLTGLPAAFILGQAALESGWGRKQIMTSEGAPSHNLFGIKAGASWKGRVAETTTTEYINGKPQKSVEKFRAYDSYTEAFRDYAALLRHSPRYEQVLAKGQTVDGFSQGLQKAGYATDPKYAEKLSRVIDRVRSV